MADSGTYVDLPDLDNIMDLSFDNLDEIYQLLLETRGGVDRVLSLFDLNEEIVEPTPQKRQLLNLVLDGIGGHLKEISHVDSFLQSCDLYGMNMLSQEQQTLLIKCQSLCQSLKMSDRQVLEWVAKMKKLFNAVSCPVQPHQDTLYENNKEQSDTKHKANTTHVVSSEMMQDYHRTRNVLKEIYSELVYFDPENMANTAGRRLQVMEEKKLFLETEHEMNVFMDYGLFQYYKEGKNILERYYDLHHSLYTGDLLDLLIAYKNVRFSFLSIVNAVETGGVVVYDALTNEQLLMVDNGLYQLAKHNQQAKQYAILTHYLLLPDFVMTTGASTPILLTTEVGKEMKVVFNKLVLHHQRQALLDEKSYKQSITDLYKIAIHGDALKKVDSRELPMNYHQLHQKDLFTH